jgi:hypothetical protein
MRIRKFFVALMMAAAPILALASWSPDTTGTIPEPETLALLGVGAVALLIARKNKRK